MRKNSLILTSSILLCSGDILAETNEPEDTILVTREVSDKHSISAAELDKFKGLSNANIFSSETNIQSNNMHNEAGAIDIGIRGIQGEGRVPVFIDGSLQSTHTSRGYQGTSDRTYIDADLISNVSLQKGSSGNKNAFSSGAIGGVVNIETIGTDDILNPGDAYGALVKLRTSNNNKKPDIPDDYRAQDYYQLMGQPKWHQFNNGSATFAFGYKEAIWDTVIAYSERTTGNYFAGKHGIERVKDPVIGKNEETVNTNFASKSFLYKLGINTDNGHQFRLAYRNHRQKAGETLAAYWYRNSRDMDYKPLPKGVTSIPQWEPGSAIVNAYSAGYSYTPENNDLLNLNMSYWFTNTNLRQYNGLWNSGINAQQYLHAYSNNRQGMTLFNDSEIHILPLHLRYGLTSQTETLKPKEDDMQRVTIYPTSRHGKRTEHAAFINSEIELLPFKINIDLNLHGTRNQDLQKNYTLNYGPKTDISSEIDYFLSDQIKIFTRAARSYRMPSLYETTVSNEVFSYNPANPIAPEISVQYEVGVNTIVHNLLIPKDSLDISASYFRNTINGFISQGTEDRTPDMPEWDENFTFMNYDKLQLSGVDLSAKYNSDLFYSSISATIYTDTSVCSNKLANRYNINNCNEMGFAWGLTPTRIPARQNIVINAGHKFMHGDLDMGIRYKYHSSKTNPAGWFEATAANPIIEIPSGYQIDLYGQYLFNKNTTLYLSINNLTDRYDIQPGSVISMPDPGRTVTVGADLRF